MSCYHPHFINRITEDSSKLWSIKQGHLNTVAVVKLFTQYANNTWLTGFVGQPRFETQGGRAGRTMDHPTRATRNMWDFKRYFTCTFQPPQRQCVGGVAQSCSHHYSYTLVTAGFIFSTCSSKHYVTSTPKMGSSRDLRQLVVNTVNKCKWVNSQADYEIRTQWRLRCVHLQKSSQSVLPS
jgi:hypothetical protein